MPLSKVKVILWQTVLVVEESSEMLEETNDLRLVLGHSEGHSEGHSHSEGHIVADSISGGGQL